jgi:hypothetical protein
MGLSMVMVGSMVGEGVTHLEKAFEFYSTISDITEVKRIKLELANAYILNKKYEKA